MRAGQPRRGEGGCGGEGAKVPEREGAGRRPKGEGSRPDRPGQHRRRPEPPSSLPPIPPRAGPRVRWSAAERLRRPIPNGGGGLGCGDAGGGRGGRAAGKGREEGGDPSTSEGGICYGASHATGLPSILRVSLYRKTPSGEGGESIKAERRQPDHPVTCRSLPRGCRCVARIAGHTLADRLADNIPAGRQLAAPSAAGRRHMLG